MELLNKQVCSTRNMLRVFAVLAALVLIHLYTCVAMAQSPEPVYRRYTVDDGLPSSMVYHAFQDSKGYMWFATANGVSRFDGYKFENFDLQSGLVDNDVFEIYEDYKHRIWFIPMSGKLCYFEDGQIVKYAYNHKLIYNPSHRGPIKNSFYVDSLDNVYISMRRSGLYIISMDGVVSMRKNNENSMLEAEELPGGKLLFSNQYIANSGVFFFKGLNQSFELNPRDLGFPYLTSSLHVYLTPTPDSTMICGMFYSLVSIKKGKIKHMKNFNADVIWMSIDDYKNLWVAVYSGGVYCYANCDFSAPPSRVLLKNNKVTSVVKDSEGAYWFTTLNDGVFYCPEINILNYTKENGLEDIRVNAITANQKGVYIGYEFGFVDLLSKNGVKNFKTTNKAMKTPIVRSLLVDSINNRVWIAAVENLYYLQNDKVYAMKNSPGDIIVFPKKLIVDSAGKCWIGATLGLVRCNGHDYDYESYAKNEYNGVIYDLIKDYKGDLWFSSINGLWKYSSNGFKYQGDDNPLFSITSYSLIQNQIDSSILVGTNGAGIIVKKGDKVSQITTKDGLISNSISNLYQKGNNIWVATRNGLTKMVKNDEGYRYENFTKANGLPTNEVTSVCEYKGTVYVGTRQGLVVFNKKDIVESYTPPNVIISNFVVNDEQINFSAPQIGLNYNQNSISIGFVGFVFRNNGEVNYRYRMLGVDSSWVYTQTPNCRYNGLADGKYRFEVEAQSYNGIWSKEPASFIFKIYPPFWKRIWFLLLLSLSITGLFFIIYRIRVNAIHRRNELLQNINLYKQQSLRQQMNPHFIFNTLNSIQLYILEKDSISSHKYLTKFARLMRMTLDNSLYSSIPLKDELEALRIYLDLERLRLEDKFEYAIDYGTDESILNFAIPTLIIQPFVENAIWHGISLRKDQMGWVKISLAENGNTITCVVEDNGVGRAAADQIRQSRKKEHKSRGSQITQQRIDLLGQMYKEKFNIIYNDLVDSGGEPMGTRVTIVIPKDMKVNVNN